MFVVLCCFVLICIITSASRHLSVGWLVGLFVSRICKKLQADLAEIFREDYTWPKLEV